MGGEETGDSAAAWLAIRSNSQFIIGRPLLWHGAKVDRAAGRHRGQFRRMTPISDAGILSASSEGYPHPIQLLESAVRSEAGLAKIVLQQHSHIVSAASITPDGLD